ncbi:MAG: HvfC/BufC family peptide modification chaperone [Nannocystales bacterium]
MSLDRFFETIAPMLEGRTPAQAVIDTLGPSPSGAENLGFYSTLVERNHFNILADVFPVVRALFIREFPGRWPELVRAYRDAHPADHWDPNRFGANFSDYLRGLRESGDALHPVFEELADLCYIRQRAFSGNESEPDAYEGRVFVRQYTHPVSDYFGALTEDPAAPLPEAHPQVVFVYRHARDASLHHFLPTAVGLAALARRQGICELPPMFGALTQDDIEAADRSLVEYGVFTPSSTTSPRDSR